MRRGRTAAVWMACAATALFVGACGERGGEKAEAPTTAQPVAAAAPKTPEPFTPSRDTPVHAATSIRELARTTWDPAFVADYIDPSQKWSNQEGGEQTGGAPALVGPALIYFARLHDLRAAAIERFGDEAGPAIDEAANFYQIDDALSNGVREMFGAAKLEQVRQIGPQAYVAPLDETGEQVGASIVLRENQGEWLWVLLKANSNSPWERKDIGFLAGILAQPMRGAIGFAREFEAMASQVRAGEVGSLSELTERVRSLPSKIG